MVDHAALLDAFGDFADALLTDFDIGAVLYRLVDHVTTVLGADGAGVSLADDATTLSFVAATDGDVAEIEERQIVQSEGPCHTAYRTGELVAVTDLEHDDRWPDYRSTALRLGVRAVLGVPMPVADRRIGALNIYWQQPHHWDETEMQVARTLGDMATGYVVNAGRLDEARTLSDQLQRALDSRIVIEQAKGVLAGRNQISTADAFERLRADARSTNTRVHELARQIVEGTPDQ